MIYLVCYLFRRKTTSIMDSIILGINQGVVLICQAVFFIMTFVIILEFVNNTCIWFGDRIGVDNMSVEVSGLMLNYKQVTKVTNVTKGVYRCLKYQREIVHVTLPKHTRNTSDISKK